MLVGSVLGGVAGGQEGRGEGSSKDCRGGQRLCNPRHNMRIELAPTCAYRCLGCLECELGKRTGAGKRKEGETR